MAVCKKGPRCSFFASQSEERNHSKSRASPRSRSADSTISRRLKVAPPIPDEDSRPQSKNPEDGDSRKTEEKQPLMSQSFPPSTNPRGNPGTPGQPEEGTVPKTTEYRSQFVAWPRHPGESPSARKSASMGLIANKDVPDGEAPSGELWNAMPTDNDDNDDAALDAVKRGRIKKTEYKAKFRPFSAYTYVDGSWKKATRLIKDNESASEEDQHAWYSEVVERLKKADQYRARSYTGAPLNGSEPLPLEFFVRDRTVLSPVSVASSSRDNLDHSKSREGSTKKKSQVEKTTVRPKSAEPVIPVKSEHKSPKRTRPRAPKDLPVHGHGDLSGRKKAYKQSAEKSSPVGMKPRAVQKPSGDEGKVWLKPDTAKEREEEEAKGEETLVNGFASEESAKMVNGDDYSVLQKMKDEARMNGEHTAVSMIKAPAKVPLTTVKSPEEVTGVRSPDPESWTVPLEIGKGLHWMDGKTPDGVQAKGPPILLSKRLKESSLIGKNQKDMVICDPGSETTGESVDL
ncbi:nuclear protein MDM1 [Caerostris darwini]|uniref:Nuclear protein MDM1 n=1 Tax=Caerostris darwini TaxID=1538125 RepID=A0AAV4TBM2_9ARAC|nr:nuclear protein MDM1 [Caerostris darwini]